jgi:hypothetical protein
MAGLKRYFTGKPCPKGHVSERVTRNGECSACAVDRSRNYERENREARNKKSREYARRNIDKIREYQAKNRKHLSKKALEWQRRNRDRVLEARRKRYWDNIDESRRKSREWKQNNPEKTAELRKRHRERRLADTRNRRAKIRQAEGSHTKDDINLLFSVQDGRCNCCREPLEVFGINRFHVDHIMPIYLGGTNGPENLQLLCPFCNMSKGNQDPYEWAESNRNILMAWIEQYG